MEILTFATGLLAGTILVRTDLAGARSAELKLDGNAVCFLTPEVPSCPVDLGPTLTAHRLDLVATPTHGGGPPEAVTRFLNLPGADSPELRVHVRAEPDGSRAIFLGWAHPERLVPSSITATLDGVLFLARPDVDLPICLPPRSGRHVVAATARFPDGQEAMASRVVGAARPAEAQGELTAVVLGTTAGREPAAETVSARLGRRVRLVEPGGTMLVVVLDPEASAPVRRQRGWRGWVAQRSGETTAFQELAADERRLRSALEAFDVVAFIHPLSRGPRFARAEPATPSERLSTLVDGIAEGDAPFRLADAVAAAGLTAAAGQRRRAVVLLAGDPRPDRSRFEIEDARSYLGELMVPLVGLRLGAALDPAWGPTRLISSEAELGTRLMAVRKSVERQRVARVEGTVLPSSLALQASDGLRLAGRGDAGE